MLDLHSFRRSLRACSPAQVSAALETLPPDLALALATDWAVIARDGQLAPEGDWTTWLFLAGRGAGKTRSGAEWVWERALGGFKRIALVAPTAADARDVMVTGESGILNCRRHERRPIYQASRRRVVWPNGAEAFLFSAEEPERLRGPQFDSAWCDELAAWRYLRETWDMLQFGLRLGENPQQVVTTTPRPLPLIKELMAQPTTRVTRGSTFDNAANLAGQFLAEVRRRYEGTRLGRQELNAEILDDVQGALWQRDGFDTHRVAAAPRDLVRVVVAVDPSGTAGEADKGDPVGIVVAGKGMDGRAYVLADRTCKESPAGWGREAVKAYYKFRADRIIGESNFGGAMIEHVIRTADPRVPYRNVHASRGKVARAEPIAALYEQEQVSHVGSFPQLEDQLAAFTGEGYVGEGSPDRADALVWALSELMLSRPVATAASGSYAVRR